MDAALKALRNKLEHDLRTCEDLVASLRSGVMHTYEVNAQCIRTYTTQARLGDFERMAENLAQAIARIDASN